MQHQVDDVLLNSMEGGVPAIDRVSIKKVYGLCLCPRECVNFNF